MAIRQRDPHKEKKENITYGLLIFFFCVFLMKGTFGIISGSRSLFVSCIPALFGIVISIATLLRIHASKHADSKEKILSHGKVEFFIITGVSLVVVISTAVLLFLIVHLVFYHTVYPPDMIAAWISAITAAGNWVFVCKVKRKLTLVEESDVGRIMHLLDIDFILSVLVIVVVVISRSGILIMDYMLAIMVAACIIPYCIYFLHSSLKGLMDASCDGKTLFNISRLMRKVDESLSIEELKVTPAGRMLDIVVIIGLLGDAKLEEAKELITKIKHVLKTRLSIPHYVHIGFKSKDG